MKPKRAVRQQKTVEELMDNGENHDEKEKHSKKAKRAASAEPIIKSVKPKKKVASKSSKGKEEEEPIDTVEADPEPINNGKNKVDSKKGRSKRSLSAPSDSNLEKAVKMPVVAKKRGPAKKKAEANDDNEEIAEDIPKKRGKNESDVKEKGRAKKTVENGEAGAQDQNEAKSPLKRARKTTKKEAESIANIEPIKKRGKKLEKEEEEEVADKKPKRAARAKVAPPQDDEEEIDDEEEEEPVEVSKKKTTSRKKTEKENGTNSKAKKGGRGKKVVELSEPDEEEDEEQSPEPEAVKPKKGGRGKKVNDTEADAASPKKTKAKAAPKKLLNSIQSDYNIDFGIKDSYNLKISCWNISGLRSAIDKGCVEYFKHEDADIICLNELKCGSEKEIPDEMKLDGYHQYWNVDKGEPGVAILTKIKPINVDYDLPDSPFEDSKRLITAEYEDFYLVCSYVVNAGRGLKTLEKRLDWNDAFDDYVQELDKKKPVIIAGDLNVAHTEIDLANPTANKKSAGFTKEEREGFTKLLSYGFVDTFRELHKDEKAYTFWSYMNNARAKNIGWRLDYFVVSERFMESVKENAIRSTIKGSDHCPVVLFIEL